MSRNMIASAKQQRERTGPPGSGKRKSGIDPQTGKLKVGRWHMPMPRSRAARIAMGSLLIVGGVLGFLPILGFWMVPLGVLVLSRDIAICRRFRRRFTVWWGRRKKRKATGEAA